MIVNADIIIKKWQNLITTLEQLIANDKEKGDMLAIMIGRKGQLLECIQDLKKLNTPTKNECRKRILSKESAHKIVANQELKGLNTGRKTGHIRSCYYCEDCKGWHVTSMIEGTKIR